MSALREEITGDPEGIGYAGKTDAEVLALLTALTRERNRTSMSGSEVLNAIDSVEYLALSGTEQDKVWQVLHLGTLNPFGVEATLLSSVFGGGSATIVALAAARKESISRAQELGLGRVREGDIARARV